MTEYMVDTNICIAAMKAHPAVQRIPSISMQFSLQTTPVNSRESPA